RGRQVAGGGVRLGGAAEDRLVVVDEGEHPLEVRVVHHPAVVQAAARVPAVHRAHGSAQVGAQAFDRAGRGHEVVGGDARLPGVGELAPHDPAGGGGGVRALVHEHGGFPAELEHGGGEVLGGGAGHDPAHGPVAGVEDQVE